MPLRPLCVVSKDGVAFLSTANGIDVLPGGTVSIKLAPEVTGVSSWYLQIIGTDELIFVRPPLTDVHPTTHLVTTPGTTVTFVFPAETGHAIGFRSEVVGTVGGGPIAT